MNRQRPDVDALQARVAARLVAVLSADDATWAVDTVERLRFARQAAQDRARQTRARTQSAPAVAPTRALAYTVAGRGGDVGWPSDPPMPWWQRASALLPLAVLVAGLVGIEHWATQEQIAVAADIDAALLSDDLPPEAYADPGFAEFLSDASRADPPPSPAP
jgi:hypothetical protein